jgi:D-inositol-3-phosphate glycosyltransferase
MTQLTEERREVRSQRSEASDQISETAPRQVAANPYSVVGHRSSTLEPAALSVALLTGGGDKPYALGMAAALTSVGIHVDFIGSDDLNVPEVVTNPRVNFLNLRGDQRADASPFAKARRVLKYYIKLIRYAATAQPRLFHLLWNNKFELFDRTLLMAYYRLAGKRVVFTGHNVNAAARNRTDSWLNRFSLRIQYRSAITSSCTPTR